MRKRKADRGANGSNGHHWIRDEKRIRIYVRDRWACVWCGCSVGLACAGPNRRRRGMLGPEVTGEPMLIDAQATLDHVIGRDAGGTHDANNLVTACSRCNSARKDLPVLSFLSYRHGGSAMHGPDPEYYAALVRLINALASPLPALTTKPRRRIVQP